MALNQVRQGRGPAWDHTRQRRAQEGWAKHAAFMDALAERGTVLLGGPLGDDVDIGDALLIASADDDDTVRSALSADPWNGTVLAINSVEQWLLWLRSPALATAIGDNDP